nr:ethylene-responsive transcription factor ERF071 [Tanacetum cinerariifolium]
MFHRVGRPFIRTFQAWTLTLIEAIGGVYETRVECVNENGKMTLQNFVLKEREPKGNRPSVKPRLESKFEFETVEGNRPSVKPRLKSEFEYETME